MPSTTVPASTIAASFERGSAVFANLTEQYLAILEREHNQQPEEADAEALPEVLAELCLSDEDYQYDLAILKKAANLEQACAGYDDVVRKHQDALKRKMDLIDDLQRFTDECNEKLRTVAGEVSTLDMQARPMKDAKGEVTGLRRRHHLLFPDVEPMPDYLMRPQPLGLKVPDSVAVLRKGEPSPVVRGPSSAA